jgi:hypothetical protein
VAVGQAPSDKQAVLYTKFKAHDAAVTALAVLKDEPGACLSRSWLTATARLHGYCKGKQKLWNHLMLMFEIAAHVVG